MATASRQLDIRVPPCFPQQLALRLANDSVHRQTPAQRHVNEIELLSSAGVRPDQVSVRGGFGVGRGVGGYRAHMQFTRSHAMVGNFGVDGGYREVDLLD